MWASQVLMWEELLTCETKVRRLFISSFFVVSEGEEDEDEEEQESSSERESSGAALYKVIFRVEVHPY